MNNKYAYIHCQKGNKVPIWTSLVAQTVKRLSTMQEWSEVKVAQSCPTLCDPMNYTVHGILQARILEWVTFLSPGDLPNPGIEPRSPALQVDSLPAEHKGSSRFNPWVGKISWRRKQQPTPVFLPGKSHGRRRLVGYSPCGRKELDTTERLHFTEQKCITSLLTAGTVVEE